ncbi:hypothetical protein RR46_03592 [Papilio xuthus]|uniref:Uncharacterized protein n=1 Tax=Papilio xuthus TaxID=66420 RepID=A0A194Q4V3_PAPXU|nr:hypothetical protein RR46_03592 [Papilio xuthus]
MPGRSPIHHPGTRHVGVHLSAHPDNRAESVVTRGDANTWNGWWGGRRKKEENINSGHKGIPVNTKSKKNQKLDSQRTIGKFGIKKINWEEIWKNLTKGWNKHKIKISNVNKIKNMKNLERVSQNYTLIQKDYKNKNKIINSPCWRTDDPIAGQKEDPCAASAGGGRVVAQRLKSKKRKNKITSFCGRRNGGLTWDGLSEKTDSKMNGYEDLPIMEDGEASVSGHAYTEDPPPSEGAAEQIKMVETSEINSRMHDESCTRRFIRRVLTWPAAPFKS